MTSKQQDIEAIAPCPFCGSQAELMEGHRNHWRVECPRCGARRAQFANGGVEENKARAVRCWNKRAPQAAFAVMSERMGAALSDDALKPVLREMYARTAEAWPAAPAWAGKAYREGERDDILFDHGLPVLRAAIRATLTRQSGATDGE